MRLLSFITFIGFLFLLSACSSSKIVTDRSQFRRDGQPLPLIELDRYKSVQFRDNQDSSLAVALAISGGGSRAANFAMGVMMGLENLKLDSQRNILNEVDYLSTVSGGGFAGGAYINALYHHEQSGVQEPFYLHKYFEQYIREDLNHSYTGTLIGALFNPKIWFSYLDDGDALEKVIDDRVLGYRRRKQAATEKDKVRSINLGDLFIDKDSHDMEVKFPIMVANASLLDKMGIFPFTPDILEQYKIDGYYHRMKKHWFEKDSFNIYSLPLAVGIKASGSFPALISNTTLRSSFNTKRKYLHVIDGAMTDNFGYLSAIDLLRQDVKAKRKVLIVIDAENMGNLPTFAKKQNARLSFKVYGRLASSGLDARRQALLRGLKADGEKLGFIPVLVGFNVLLKDNDVLPPAVIDIKKEQSRLTQLLSTGQDISLIDRQILYDLVTNIGTKYTITESEQELLLLTGKKIIQLIEKDIRAAVNRN